MLSPGLLYLGDPGKRSTRPCPTPTGLWLLTPGGIETRRISFPPVCPLGDATPLELGGASRSFPRVAEYCNPGLIDETLSG